MALFVGTSGWQYKDWKAVLYPPKTPQRLWLEAYARAYATVECDAAFYRLPPFDTFADWRQRTPDDFVIAVKANRFLTHIKRLRDPQEPVRRMLAAVAGLGDRLGPILLQLPPTLRADPALLDSCLACFPAPVRVAVEPRHASWWTPAIRDVLERHESALCWADRLSRPVTPLWRTCDWGYVRLHQGRASTGVRYGRRALASWLERLSTTWFDEADVYTYFNNDSGGAAVLDALNFARMARRAGLSVSRASLTAQVAP